ncbi:MAG: sigma-54-dependent transcriptional regulator [Bacteriovoracaceae bacterium]
MRTKNLATLMIIDDDPDLLDLLSAFFRQKGYNVSTFEDARMALNAIENKEIVPDVVISDLRLPVMDGVEFIKRIRKFNMALPIILMTAEGSVEIAVEAIDAGAYDFVLKPLQVPQLLISVQRALFLNQMQTENTNLKNIFQKQEFLGLKGVIGRSAGFKAAMDLAQRVSGSQANVILSGESGSGKEVVARAVHDLGERKNDPFIAINCSAIPENLLESELFGYTKGAFTGAMGMKIGLFEEAGNGTIFLDEIGDLALPLQAKLLRVLQERKIKRLGENQTRDINARIICATHKDLKKEVAEGRFREDLYFRLNVIPIFMPPLRERKEDILPLSEFFLKKFCLMNNMSIKGFTKEALARLEELPWKGNVRELENAIERAVVLSRSEFIQLEDLPQPSALPNAEGESNPAHHDSLFSINELMSLEDLSMNYIEFIYRRNNFAKEQTAKELGIDRKTLYRKLKEIQP